MTEKRGRIATREKVRMKVSTIQRKNPPYDYLKFFKVVNHWAKRKYDLTSQEIDLMLFLRSEHIFTRTAFKEYMNIFHWNAKMWSNLVERGIIITYREKSRGRHALYELSPKAKKIVASIYRKCNGEEGFSENGRVNPCFNRKTATYMDKVFSSQMKKINEINRKARLKPVKGPAVHRGG